MSEADAFVKYFKCHPFGTQPEVMSILGLLPPADQCDILGACMYQYPYNVYFYDMYAVALYSAGQMAAAYDLLDEAVSRGYLDNANSSSLSQKLKSFGDHSKHDFGSAKSSEHASELLEKVVAQLNVTTGSEELKEFIEIMKAYVDAGCINERPNQSSLSDDSIDGQPRRFVREDKAFYFTCRTVKGCEVLFEVEEAEGMRDYVLSGRYRQPVESPLGLIHVDLKQKVEDLFSDIDLIARHLDNSQLKSQDFWEAFVQLIIAHVNKYGRLVNLDLEGYVDTILIVMDAISSAFNWPPLTQSEGFTLRKKFLNTSSQAFREVIWVQDTRQDHFPGQGPKIIKLTDFQSGVA